MASRALVSVLLAISLCEISCLDLTVLDTVHGETPLDPNDLLTKLKREQSLNANLQKNVTSLLNQIQGLQSTVQTVQQTVVNITATMVAALSTTTPAPTTHGPFAVADQQRAVAYEGILDSDSSNFVKNDTLKFVKDITNVGNAYNHTTGIFTCPVRGMYLFGITLIADGTREITTLALDFTSSSGTRVIARPHTEEADGLLATGETAVVKAESGDFVRVRYVSSTGTALINRFTRFSGVLIQQLA